VLRALQLALESAGHAVVAAASGPALMDLLGTRTPDIVISDYRLGDNQTGFGVIAQARATFGAALPALLITGDTDPDLIRRMSEQGIAVLFKPLQIEALLAAIGAATAA
jgi:CheY-like chemotaxis protein